MDGNNALALNSSPLDPKLEARSDSPRDFSQQTPEDAEFLASFTEADRKRIVRKVDFRLLPWLALLYLISFLDRTNLANAKIEGLSEELHLDGVKYNIVTAIFFIGYILLEVPLNSVLAKLQRPSRYIGGLTMLWGLVMTLHGFVQNYAGLCAMRVLLGIAEAGLFPGAIYLVSSWYLPNETQTRVALFFSTSAAAGAFGGLLAFAIANMDGLGGYRAWRWIFIIEGLASILAGLFTYLFMPDSPSLSTFLTPDEARFLVLRHRFIPGRRKHGDERDGKVKSGILNWNNLRSVLSSWQIYLIALIDLSSSGPNYALRFTMPQIIKNMGNYSSSTAQLLTIPPYTCGVIGAVAFAMAADRARWRMPFLAAADTIILIAHAIMYRYSPTQHEHIVACYFAICLACVGLYPVPPGAASWLVDNTAPSEKRAMAVGLLIGIGNIGGIFGGFVYRDEEAPYYSSGYATAFALGGAGLITGLILEVTYWFVNRKRDGFDEDLIREKYGEDELERMGDRSPLFRYSY